VVVVVVVVVLVVVLRVVRRGLGIDVSSISPFRGREACPLARKQSPATGQFGMKY
jgi:hypothetical protein